MEKSLSEEEEDGDTESEETETSQLILFGNDYFITDMQISSYYNPMVFIYNNADLFLNSVAYLTDNDEDITLRKNQTSSNVTFTATEGEQDIILKLIFVVPVAIIALGIIVWIIRRNKK